MPEYYPIKIEWSDKTLYFIWFTDDLDGIFTEHNHAVSFLKQIDLVEFAKQNKIHVANTPTAFNFRLLEAWLKDPSTEIDCTLFVNAWNLFLDFSYSTGIPFEGNISDGLILVVYNKLFYGSNPSALCNVGEEYKPQWDNSEKEALWSVLSSGLLLLNQAVKRVSCWAITI